MKLDTRYWNLDVGMESKKNVGYKLWFLPFNRQQTTDNRQQTTDNRQQTTDNRQQTTNNSEPLEC